MKTPEETIAEMREIAAQLKTAHATYEAAEDEIRELVGVLGYFDDAVRLVVRPADDPERGIRYAPGLVAAELKLGSSHGEVIAPTREDALSGLAKKTRREVLDFVDSIAARAKGLRREADKDDARAAEKLAAIEAIPRHDATVRDA